jgi:hypothetical protein
MKKPEDRMMFKIEDGYEIPAERQPRKRRAKYPWNELNVGQSFFVDGAKLRSMSSTASHAGRRLSRKFVVRNAEHGVRVWRLD